MSRFHRGSTGSRWATTRLLALLRDGYRCVRCQKAGRLEVDHVVPVHRGGAEYELSNTQTLCKKCHISKTLSETRRQTPARRRWQQLVDSL